MTCLEVKFRAEIEVALFCPRFDTLSSMLPFMSGISLPSCSKTKADLAGLLTRYLLQKLAVPTGLAINSFAAAHPPKQGVHVRQLTTDYPTMWY